MRVLVIQRSDRAIRDCARVSTRVVKGNRIADVEAEPLGRTGDVGQARALLAVSIENSLVRDDQSLVRPDGSGARQEIECDVAIRVAEERDIEVRVLCKQRRYRRRAQGIENLRGPLAWCRVAGSAIGLVWQDVVERDLVGRRCANVVHIQGVHRGHAELQLRRPGFLEGQIRLDNRHVGRRARIAGQDRRRRVVEAVISVGRGVVERQPGHVGRRVVDTHRDIEHDLLPNRNVHTGGRVLDDEVGAGSGIDRCPCARTGYFRNADVAQVGGRGTQVVEDAHVVERRQVRCGRYRDLVGKFFANRRSRLRDGLG